MAPYPQKVRVALFIEYFAVFWSILWERMVSCIPTHFRRENYMPAMSGSDAVQNWDVDLFAATTRERAIISNSACQKGDAEQLNQGGVASCKSWRTEEVSVIGTRRTSCGQPIICLSDTCSS